MSYYDDDINELGTQCNVLPRGPGSEPSGPFDQGVWQGYISEPVVFSPPLAQKIKEEVELAFSSKDPLKHKVSHELVKLCGNEVKRFICAIDGYFNSSNPLLSRRMLFDGITDFSFASYLKKLRFFCTSRRKEGSLLADDGLTQSMFPIQPNQVVDIGDIFNYKYWFFWEEPTTDDWKYSMLPVEVNNEFIVKFEEVLEGILPKLLEPVDPKEVLISMSSSSCMTPDFLSKSKVFKIKEGEQSNVFDCRPLKGKLTVVRKTPTDVREAITLTVGQSNVIKLIEKQCAILAANLPYSAYGLTKDEFKDSLESFWKNNNHFVNRDLTKEGWTKPRWILRSIGRLCRKKYPDCVAFKMFSIFDGFTLILEDGTSVETCRGHGLGMANALTTIMQIVFFILVRNEAVHDLEGKMSALFYNDDGSIGTNDSEASLTYSELEDPILEEGGLLRKDKKTFISGLSVLCERYSDLGYGLKESYTRFIRRIPFASTCIVDAKSKTYMLTDPEYGLVEHDLIKRLTEFFGSEAPFDESQLPYFFGGWFRPRWKGVEMSFLDIQSVSQEMAVGFLVGQPRTRPDFYKGPNRVFKHPLEYTYDVSEMDPRIVDYFGVKQNYRRVSSTYSRNFDRQSYESFLVKECQKRYNQWRQPARVEPLEFYYNKVVRDNPFIDILPPPLLARFKPLEDITTDSVNRTHYPVHQPSPILGSISYFSGMKYIPHTVPVPWLPNRSLDRLVFNSERLDKYQESMLSTPLSSTLNMGVPVELTNRVFTERFWNNDYNVYDAFTSQSRQPLEHIIPPLRSLGGEINHEARNVLSYLEVWGGPDFYKVWNTYGRSVVMFIVAGILTEEDFAMDDVVETHEEPKADLAPPEDVDFWFWRSDRSDHLVPPWMLTIFLFVEDKLLSTQVCDSMKLMSDNRESDYTVATVPWREGDAMDKLVKRVCHVTGTWVGDAYILRPPDTDVFGGDSDDELGGVFGDLPW